MLQTYKTILTQKTFLTEDVMLFSFVLIEPKELVFTAGQYLILPVMQSADQIINRLYSIASSQKNRRHFNLMVKIIPNGIASTYLSKININSEIVFQGPAGVFIMRQTPRQKIYLVTGTGLAPVWSMIESGTAGNIPQYLLWGLPYFKDMYFFDKLKEQANINPNFHFTICLSREKNLNMISEKDKKHFVLGRVTGGLDSLITDYRLKMTDCDSYLCSGREIIESLKSYSEQKGAPKEQIFFERF